MINQGIAHYRITARLGQGGMGAVYRATDTKLHREVAIKVLPESFAQDKERLARFDREAKALAALNHPNIAGIFGIEQSGHSQALVLELVEGEDLSERLKRGALSVDEALNVCRQIAEALEAAHEKGIIHRDLKPGNVKLTADGKVKVLDFGLAKALVTDSSATGPADSLSPTITAESTLPGTLLGTAGYMSPEQARGKAVDKRSDIWSFGCVLYECLTGRRAFQGEDTSETLAAIIKGEPDWSQLPERVPPLLKGVLRQCLQKDPRHRWRDLADVRIAIETAREASAAATPRTPPPSRGAGLGWLLWAATAVLAIALAVVLWGGLGSPRENRWTGEWLGGPDVALVPSISTNGQMVAFIAMVDGLTQIAVMKPESGNYQVLTKDRTQGGIVGIAWSADSTRIYYARYLDSPRGIYSVPVFGGEERLVRADAQGPAVLRDGSLLIVQLNSDRKKQLYRFWPETGHAEPLGALLAGTVGVPVAATPSGDRAVFYGTPLQEPDVPPHLYAIELGSGQVIKVASDVSMAGVSDGFTTAIPADGESVVFSLQAGDAYRFVRVPLDGGSQVQTLMTLTSQSWGLSISPDGWFYTSLVDRTGEVVRLSPSGGKAEHIVQQPYFENSSTGSQVEALALPDGRTVFCSQKSSRLRLMVTGPGREPAPFVETQDQTAPPVAMLGPSQAAFVIGEGGNRTIGIASISNGRVVRRLNGPRGANINSIAVSADNETIYYAVSGSVWSVPVNDGTPQFFHTGDSITIDPYKNDLIVKLHEPEAVRLLRVPLDGGPEQSIPIEPGFGFAVWNLHPNAVGPNGKIVLAVTLPSSFFWPAALLDPETGRVEILDVGYGADMPSPGWTPEGDLIVTAFPMRSNLWRFRAEQVGN